VKTKVAMFRGKRQHHTTQLQNFGRVPNPPKKKPKKKPHNPQKEKRNTTTEGERRKTGKKGKGEGYWRRNGMRQEKWTPTKNRPKKGRHLDSKGKTRS